MYNHYAPSDAAYTRVTPDSPPPGGKIPLLGGLLKGGEGREGIRGALHGVLKGILPDRLDAGDLLLALIVLLILVEDGDDLDIVITLGLMLVFSLGES